MSRKEQGYRGFGYGSKYPHFSCAYTEWGLKCLEMGFIHRIRDNKLTEKLLKMSYDERTEEFNKNKRPSSYGSVVMFGLPFTDDLRSDILHSPLSDEVANDLINNLDIIENNRKKKG